jgi:hypothetical protein
VVDADVRSWRTVSFPGVMTLRDFNMLRFRILAPMCSWPLLGVICIWFQSQGLISLRTRYLEIETR